MTRDATLQVAHRVADTEAEGPGRRFALWLQGCPLRCPGCCNPQMLPFRGGVEVAVSDLLDEIARSPHVEGISLLGGEPFAQAHASARLAEGARGIDLSVMIYSGFTLAQLRARPDAAALLAACDLLVDGPYLREQPESRRRWIGSRNQCLHFLSDRYTADDPRFFAPNTVELRLSAAGVSINGWPTP